MGERDSLATSLVHSPPAVRSSTLQFPAEKDTPMARSLTIKHEETASTSWIMTGFLALAFGWLAATAIFASTADATSPQASPSAAE